jgi:2-C-methyl-D-erythritol 2,4-cyclodiphosphate synthase
LELRVGHGYDLHRLEQIGAGGGKPLVIGGVKVEHDLGPVAHSDGDALYHAVTDALLGAVGLPDIGQLFPDTDPRHESEDSVVFLRAAAEKLAGRRWQVVNVDATVILERPKIGPLKDQMRSNIARALGMDVGAVNVKGKTHEKVDAVGEGRAIEVHVVVMVRRV